MAIQIPNLSIAIEKPPRSFWNKLLCLSWQKKKKINLLFFLTITTIYLTFFCCYGIYPSSHTNCFNQKPYASLQGNALLCKLSSCHDHSKNSNYNRLPPIKRIWTIIRPLFQLSILSETIAFNFEFRNIMYQNTCFFCF